MGVVWKWACETKFGGQTFLVECPFAFIEQELGQVAALQQAALHVKNNPTHILKRVIAWHPTLGDPVP